jgi:hypothetical protein
VEHAVPEVNGPAPPKRPRLGGRGGDPLTGRARSTTATRKSHIKVFDKLMKEDLCTFDQVTESECEDKSHIENVLALFAHKLAYGGLTKRDADGDETGSPLSCEYLCNVWSTVTNELFEKFPDAKGVNDLKYSTYVTDGKQRLQKVYNRNYLTGSQEDSLITKTYPIFRETDPRRKIYLTHNVKAGFGDKDGDMQEVPVDLSTICQHISASKKDKIKTKHKKKLALSLGWQFVSRADEPAFLSWDKVYWESYLDCAVVNFN